MDLLSRLIAGSAATSPSKQKLNTSADRLSACKRICGTLQQIWRNGTRLSNDSSASKHVAILLDRLNNIIHDESRKAAPHSCLLYTASSQIYIIVTKLALSSDSAQVISTARQFFHILINGEVEGVLDSKIFARSMIDLVRRSTVFNPIVLDSKDEADLIELLFEIATKIRLDPDLLPGWFYPERDAARHRHAGGEARRAQFPLFYLLVDYVHQDGTIGDFARTGLLYLTDTASKSKLLEKWMIESDLAPQMASGLSALYSRLSRRTFDFTEHEKALPIIALSDVSLSSLDRDDSLEDEAQQSIKAFMSYLAFWQDTLNHCKSIEVKETLLDHFQVLFVQQLLYPSLLESSDVAGGSAAAVMLHLYRILNALEHQPLIHRMLRYLLAAASPSTVDIPKQSETKRISMSRRVSMEALETMTKQANAPSPNLFTLYDLLVLSLHSRHSQTVNASLKLISMILQRHHNHVLNELFIMQPMSLGSTRTSLQDFDENLQGLLVLAENIAQNDSADESYEAAIHDGRMILEQHSCLVIGDQLDREVEIEILQISSSCRLFESMLELMSSWFANDTTINIMMTETFVFLASCEHVSMYSWLFGSQEDIASPTSLRIVMTALIAQVTAWKSQFPEWNSLFLHQRTSLAGDEVEIRDPRSASERSRNSSAPSPQRRPSTPVRSLTPRGQKMPPPTFGSIDSTLANSPKLGPVPNKIVPASPLHQTTFPGEASPITSVRSLSTASNSTNINMLKQQVILPDISHPTNIPTSILPQMFERVKLEGSGSGSSTPQMSDLAGSGAMTPGTPVRTTASLGHIIINAVILQEFILELAAIFQIRGTLFDEVDLL